MRLKPGRPDLARLRGRFTVEPARPDDPLAVTWAGVTTLLVDDGATMLLTDGYFSRPGLARVALGTVAPAPARIDGALARLGAHRLAAVIPVHTHLDHALDSAVVAARTGARLVGAHRPPSSAPAPGYPPSA